jgi:hypothetical protein
MAGADGADDALPRLWRRKLAYLDLDQAGLHTEGPFGREPMTECIIIDDTEGCQRIEDGLDDVVEVPLARGDTGTDSDRNVARDLGDTGGTDRPA